MGVVERSNLHYDSVKDVRTVKHMLSVIVQSSVMNTMNSTR